MLRSRTNEHTRFACALLGLCVSLSWTPARAEDSSEPFPRMANDELLAEPFCRSVQQVVAGVKKAASTCTEKGDARTEALIREGLKDLDLAEPHRRRAILLGLAVSFDTGIQVRQSVLTNRFWTKYESEADRKARIRVLGKPTMYGRFDLAQHFFIAAGLVALTSPEAAEATSILKEVTDANGGSGFSYIDLGASLSGVIYADEYLRGRPVPDLMGSTFDIRAVLPDFSDQAEGVMLTELRNDFSLNSESRFRRVVADMKTRIWNLPIYAYKTSGEIQTDSAAVKGP